MKHHIIYKVTNLANNKIYVGAHETDNLEDGYLGSGKYIVKAVNKYGEQSFKKEVLLDCQSKEEMYQKEKEIVNEDFIKRKDTYNIVIGGEGHYREGMVTVKDKEGNILSVSRQDPRYISRELVSISKEMIIVKDKQGNILKVHRKDPRFLSGELVSIFKGTVVVKDKNGKISRVDRDDDRIKTGELVNPNIGYLNAKDKDGNIFRVTKDDIRLASGELKGFYSGGKSKGGYKHTEETKKKLSKMKSGCIPTQAQRDALSKANKGKKKPEGFGEQISKALTGKQKTKEHCDNISKAKIGKHLKFTEEDLKRRSESRRGTNNFFYGKCLVIKGVEKKWIKKEELNTYQGLGWTKYNQRWNS